MFVNKSSLKIYEIIQKIYLYNFLQAQNSVITSLLTDKILFWDTSGFLRQTNCT